MEDDPVPCELHGAARAALICRHLREPERRAFYAVPRCEHGPAQAWCEECDEVVAAEHGWTDRSEEFARFQLFCARCYDQALSHHRFLQFSQGPDDDCDWSSEPAPGGVAATRA